MRFRLNKQVIDSDIEKQKSFANAKDINTSKYNYYYDDRRLLNVNTYSVVFRGHPSRT